MLSYTIFTIFFFFNDTATTEIYTLSLHDALPILILLCLLSISNARAQSVTVEAKIDSLQILIGEQTKIQLQVAMDAKQQASFPAYVDTIVNKVEIIEAAKLDTQYLNDRQRMLITQEYTITSLDRKST